MGRDACLQSLFYLSTRVLSKGALTPSSLHRAPRERRRTSRASFNHLPKSPVEEPTPGCLSPHGDAHLHSLPFITFRAPSKGAPSPGSPNSSHRDRSSIASALLQLILKVPSRWTPSPGSPMGPLWRDIHLIHVSKSPESEPPSRLPNRAPMERDACHQSLLPHKLQGPQEWSPLQVSFTVPIERYALFTEPSNYQSYR